MAGRHGVPPQERRTHARQASGQRRSRAQRRDAAQPWALWLAFRLLLSLVVLAAGAWSVLLLTQRRGGIWPVIAVVAGALSLLMIGLDVRARRRQRAQLHRRTVPRVVEVSPAPPPPSAPPAPIVPVIPDRAEPVVRAQVEPEVEREVERAVEPEPPRRVGRHSHRA